MLCEPDDHGSLGAYWWDCVPLEPDVADQDLPPVLSDISIQLAKKDAKKVETNFTIAVTSPSVTCYFSSVPSTAIYPQVLAVLAQTDWAHPTLHKLSSGSATYNANMYRTNPFLRTLTAV